MTTKPASDDLEAVRAIVDALEGFPRDDQERVIRWAREKLGLSQVPLPPPSPPGTGVATPPTPLQPAVLGGTDIKSFVGLKAPQSDTHFAATVAYYYKFEAPEAERKDVITSDDLQDACRKVNRDRFNRPIVALGNAHRDGLLDKAERGSYKINSVGENLVAMALPAPAGKPLKRKPKVAARNPKKSKKR